MLVMWMGGNLGLMGSVVVSEDTLTFSDIRIGVTHANRITQFRADHLVEVEIRGVPEKGSATEQPVLVIRGQTRDRFPNLAYMCVLAKAALDGCEIVVNGHADVRSRCMNWRTGSEVR